MLLFFYIFPKGMLKNNALLEFFAKKAGRGGSILMTGSFRIVYCCRWMYYCLAVLECYRFTFNFFTILYWE